MCCDCDREIEFKRFNFILFQKIWSPSMAGRRPRPSGPRSPRSPRAGRGKRYRDLMNEQEEADSNKKQRSAGPDDGGADKVV